MHRFYSDLGTLDPGETEHNETPPKAQKGGGKDGKDEGFDGVCVNRNSHSPQGSSRGKLYCELNPPAEQSRRALSRKWLGVSGSPCLQS